jgi:hypothetical protein
MMMVRLASPYCAAPHSNGALSLDLACIISSIVFPSTFELLSMSSMNFLLKCLDRHVSESSIRALCLKKTMGLNLALPVPILTFECVLFVWNWT